LARVFFPYKDDNPRRHGPPLATLAIIGVSTAVYLLVQAPLGPREGQAYALSFGFIPAVFFGQVELAGELKRIPSAATLITSMFSHGGLAHLVGNMWFLWLFGDNVEDAMGRVRYPLFYLICGVVGTLAHAAVDPASRVPAVGASGAISGVMAAYLLIWPRANMRVCAAGGDAGPGRHRDCRPSRRFRRRACHGPVSETARRGAVSVAAQPRLRPHPERRSAPARVRARGATRAGLSRRAWRAGVLSYSSGVCALIG
jgi:membrane associated rhomboid family serine protease